MNRDKTHEKINAKMQKNFPTDEEKIQIISTLLGAGIMLLDQIMRYKHFMEISDDVRYQMALMAGNAMAILSDGDPSFNKLDLSANSDTKAKLAMVIKALYESCVEKGLIK
jgi:hypothetical protein